MSVQKILNRENRTIVYEYEPKPQKSCIVYLHGLNSSRQSEKGKRLLKFAKEKNYAFLSVDYTAHGESEGTPADFRVARCLNDVLDVMDKEKIVNPLYLVGSSLGGWIAFLLAEKMQNQVKGILTCAAGVDFLERVWRKMLPQSIKLLLKSGHIIGPNAETKGYCFSYAMFQEAKPYLLLHRKINYTGPVILAHGDADTVVLPDNSFKIKEALLSQDVQVHIIKGEGHALSGYPLEQEVERLIWKGEKNGNAKK